MLQKDGGFAACFEGWILVINELAKDYRRTFISSGFSSKAVSLKGDVIWIFKLSQDQQKLFRCSGDVEQWEQEGV